MINANRTYTKKLLLIGASRGLGYAIAEEFLKKDGMWWGLFVKAHLEHYCMTWLMNIKGELKSRF